MLLRYYQRSVILRQQCQEQLLYFFEIFEGLLPFFETVEGQLPFRSSGPHLSGSSITDLRRMSCVYSFIQRIPVSENKKGKKKDYILNYLRGRAFHIIIGGKKSLIIGFKNNLILVVSKKTDTP